MRPAHRVISNTLAVALEPLPGRVQGRQGFCGVERRLVLPGNLPDVTRRPPAVPPDLAPMFRGALKVSCLPGLPETPASNFPKALLALSLPKHYQAALEDVPHRHTAP